MNQILLSTQIQELLPHQHQKQPQCLSQILSLIQIHGLEQIQRLGHVLSQIHSLVHSQVLSQALRLVRSQLFNLVLNLTLSQIRKKNNRRSCSGQNSGRRSNSGGGSSSDRQPKGSNDPIKMANKFGVLYNSMET